MSPYPDEPPRDEDPPREDGETAEFERANEPDSGVTDEYEAAFGDEFGADVADELAAEEVEDDPDAAAGDEEEPESAVEDEEEPDDEVEVDAELEQGEGVPETGARDPLEVLSQETVEADVVALADEEEQRERAAREAAEALEAQAAAASNEDAEEETPGEEEAGGAEAEETPPGEREAEEPAESNEPPKVGIWARFLTASLVIVISMATATSVSILLYLSDIAKGLGGIPDVQDQLEAVEGGDPQNILVLGSDRRPDLEEAGRSDTTMLLRIDPDNDAIALLSLPRDLRVNIPGRGIAKLNEAYTLGGPEKTLQVVKQLTGLNIHHVVNVDFEGFSQAINAIECVYVDVDRQYFHSNEGLSIEDYYAEIDIQAGYQILCGDRALQYVRYRHTDNDLVRGARQQDFLREARQKIGPSRLLRDREELIDIFKKYTTSDIDNQFTMLDVLKTFLGAANAPVKQIHFQGELGQSYVTASNEQIQKAVEQFLGIEDTPGSLGDEGSGGGSGGRGKGEKKKEEKKTKPGRGGSSVTIDSTGAGVAWAERFAPAVGFGVFYPTRLAPGSTITNESREYKIADEDKQIHRAYKMVFSIPGGSVPLEFYGLMGTTWLDPPILDNPSETREIGGREYDLFYDGDRLRMVAWRTKKAAYWLNNTLLQTLEEGQMLAIADSMEEIAPPKKK
jgi:polyisoprenyl-teichoic acid--peptidoglycan teichoic acid transferase